MTLANKTEVGCTPLLHETIFAIQFRNGTAMISGNNNNSAKGIQIKC